MRIAFITETWPPQVNGVALTVHALAQALAARGAQVEVVRPGPDAREVGLEMVSARGIAIPRYPGMQFGLPAGNALRRRWTALRPDAVYIATEGPLGGSAMRIANSLGIPVISGFHTRFDTYATHYGVGLLAPLVRSHLLAFHRRAQVTLVPTRALRAELMDAGMSHVQTLRRGVDTELFTPRRRDPALRSRWGAREEAPVMLCVARLAAEKNLDVAVQAFRALHARVPAARLVMVGDGPRRDALVATCPDVLFAGTKRGVELAAHYASADLFLFPSLSETFGNVVLEAMASGVPVVAFDHAAAAEHVIDGVCGRIVPARDNGAFITSTYQLGTNREARRMMGGHALIAAGSCTTDAMVDEFESLLNELVGGLVPGGLPHDHFRTAA